MNIAVVGTGYVGLVTGVCFAEVGNTVSCVDKDAAKVERMRGGECPIYEVGLPDLIPANIEEGRLEFTTSLPEALRNAEVVFIAVGTYPAADGSADLSHVMAVAREIGRNLDHRIVVVDKSTVPVGTGERVRAAIQDELDARGVNVEFSVVSNPEFLKEGCALKDFTQPDR
ncbi:MAG TPA: 2-dehydropantoate 2-reductase N-terminal domain-containing protein, partial [Gammaproteobacteria bacterium]